LTVDNQSGSVTIGRDADGSVHTVLPGAPGIATIYSAWFDTLALAPSTAARAVLLYDLDEARLAGTIPLPAVPARGAVTPDGKKLYLPLPDAGRVAVLDASRRALVASIAVPGTPSLVLLAGSYGICH
jgi:DNA-binding beta-propeller fold protein YncE